MFKCCEFFLPDFVSAKAKSFQGSGIDQLKRNVGRLFVDDSELSNLAVHLSRAKICLTHKAVEKFALGDRQGSRGSNLSVWKFSSTY